MDKRDYFLKAMALELFLKKDWVISAFSVFREEADAWKNDPYPLRLVRQGNDGYFAVNPDNVEELIQLTGALPNEPLFAFKEKVKINNGDLPNYSVRQSAPFETTYGRLLFNWIVLVWPFGSKVSFDYAIGGVDTGKLEAHIAANLHDTPAEGEQRDPGKLYVDELVKYGEAIGALAGYTTLCVPAASESTLVPDPAIIARRDELLAQYKDQLKDPAVIAKIEKELTDMFLEKMKGDPAEGFLVKAKTVRVALKKLLIIHGIESGFGEPDTITTSLNEGWQVDKMPAYINSLRSGSYSRGSQTELGGEAVKTFHRVFQNTIVAEEDCGTPHGMKWTLNDHNYKSFEGQNMILQSGKIQQLSVDYLKANIGKTIEIRSPMLCKTKAPSFCAVCMGEKYGRNPTGLSVAAAEVGSTFMSVFMAAMHGKQLATAQLQVNESIT